MLLAFCEGARYWMIVRRNVVRLGLGDVHEEIVEEI